MTVSEPREPAGKLKRFDVLRDVICTLQVDAVDKADARRKAEAASEEEWERCEARVRDWEVIDAEAEESPAGAP